jgi:putative salt-induced outer membrane protein
MRGYAFVSVSIDEPESVEVGRATAPHVVMRSRSSVGVPLSRKVSFDMPSRFRVRSLAALSAVAVSLVSGLASAQQPVPDSAVDPAKATTGKNDITDDKSAAMSKPDKEAKDANELALSFGGLEAGGNSRLVAATALGRYRLRRGDEQFKAAIAGNYGRTAAPGGDWATTVENFQGLARYDHFLGDFTLFLSAQGRNDKFQGLNLRLRIDPGVGYYFVNESDQQLWVELGYDFRFDDRRSDSLTELDGSGSPVLDATGQPVRLPKTAVLHSGRVFVGYSLALSDDLTWSSGVEFLQGLSDTKQYSINGDSSLSVKVRKTLAVSFAFSERYDSTPLPGKQNLDTMTTVSLVYTFL